MQITVEIRNVYGRELVYPVCDTAEKLAKLAGNVTLSKEAIATIKNLGYNVQVKPREI